MCCTVRPSTTGVPSPKSHVNDSMAANGREAPPSNEIGSCSSPTRSSPASATNGSSGTTMMRTVAREVCGPLATVSTAL